MLISDQYFKSTPISQVYPQLQKCKEVGKEVGKCIRKQKGKQSNQGGRG